MKKVIIIVLFLGLFLNAVFAQKCDIAQTGVTIYNSNNTAQVTSIPWGQNANFRFSIKNIGTDPACSIPANSVTAVFDFPTLAGGIRPYIYDGPATFSSGFFTWTYNNVAQVLMGTNTTAIPQGKGDMDILVKVIGNAGGAGSSNLNITQGKGISDNSTNNFSGSKLIVAAASPLSVKLSAFTAVPDECDVVLNWTTLSEQNFSHFEVEYSPDGVTFIKIGSVEGKNIATGADYSYTYTQLSGNGYYRLKQVDIDGKFEYSGINKVVTNCNGKNKVIIYPNPVSYNQKLIINISGFTGKIRGEMFDAVGQKVASYSLANKANEISVRHLSAGSYMLYVSGEEGEAQSFKIIITR